MANEMSLGKYNDTQLNIRHILFIYMINYNIYSLYLYCQKPKGVEDFYLKVIIPFMEWNLQMSGPLGFHGEGTALKAASFLLGLPAGPCRRPHHQNISKDNMDKLKNLLESWDLI